MTDGDDVAARRHHFTDALVAQGNHGLEHPPVVLLDQPLVCPSLDKRFYILGAPPLAAWYFLLFAKTGQRFE